MKKLFIIPLMIVLVSALVFGGCSKPAPPEVIELSLNLNIPPTHSRWVKGLEPWAREIENRSNGKVKIVPYFSSALSSVPEQYDSVVTGVADMAETAIMVPGQLTMTQTLMKLTTASKFIGNPSAVAWELYKTVPAMQDEFKETKLISLSATGPIRFGTTKKPVKKLEDIKGQKINVIAGGLEADKLQALGASTEHIAPTELYMALEKGVIDGSSSDYELLVARKWGDSLKYMTNISICYFAFYIVMNLDKWNSLPPDVQGVFEELGGDYMAEFMGGVRSQIDSENKITWETEMGGTSFYPSEEELTEADRLFQPLIDATIVKMEGKGLPMKQAYQSLLKLEEKYSIPWPRH